MSDIRPGFLSRATAARLGDAVSHVGGLLKSGLGAGATRIAGPNGQYLQLPAEVEVADMPRSYLLDVPCLVFSAGVVVGLAGVVVNGSGASAECVVKGECGGDCGSGDIPPSPPPPVTTTISGNVGRTGDGAGPVVGRAVELLGAGTTVTTDAGGNYSFTGVSGPSLRFVQLTLTSGEVATNVVDGGGSVAGAVATVLVTTTTHDADFTISTETPSPPVPPSPPPPPGPPPVPPPGSGGGE